MMGGGMKGVDMMQGCDMMGGGMMDHGMMGGDKTRMQHMMTMMQEKLSRAGDRVASLKTELKITEAQTPAWNKFADALLTASKTMEGSMEAKHKQMMQPAGAALTEQLESRVKMASGHVDSLKAIKAALDPLYASFSDEQKKLADKARIGPMGLM
ncbi:MAG: Spy/CpxP family protein refolding chaperone [Beijerinckiaceae bacterium]|nr:Spy/CpxP family protein refolding chaperone [Beijerinckiaceae bacterium]